MVNKHFNTIHGFFGTAEYRIWQGFRNRCLNPKNKDYPRYGGRGITVHPDWIPKNSFMSFYDHVGARPSKLHSLDRIDNSKGYEPGNVRWATPKEQATNRTDCFYVIYLGVKINITQACESIKTSTARLRYWESKGMSLQDAFYLVQRKIDKENIAKFF